MRCKLNSWACARLLSNSKLQKRNVCFFVVPGNGQALLRLPDMMALNIINLNIDSIQKEIRECKTEGRQHMLRLRTTETRAHREQSNKMAMIKTLSKQINQLLLFINNIDADKGKSKAMTQQIYEENGKVFNGIGCFEGTFSLQLKLDSKPYQVAPRHIAYALQKTFREELQQLQELDIIMPLGVDETAEWCNSFVLVPKANGKVQLCLDPV